jgi:hypothetical protein
VIGRSVLFAGLAMLSVGSGVAGASAVGDAGRPTVSASFPANRVTAGARFKVDYKTHDLPTGSTLFLQRQEGSAHVWKRVERLKGRAGTAEVPKVALGRWEYRIEAWKGPKPVTASAEQTLFSYGNVPYGEMCSEYGGCNGSGDVQIGDTDYSYADYHQASDTYPTYDEAINFAHSTTCRSADLSFAGTGNFDGAANFTTYERLIQRSSDPESAVDTPTTVGHLHARFDGGPWILDFAVSRNSGLYPDVFFNGVFSCYTSTGQ